MGVVPIQEKSPWQILRLTFDTNFVWGGKHSFMRSTAISRAVRQMGVSGHLWYLS